MRTEKSENSVNLLATQASLRKEAGKGIKKNKLNCCWAGMLRCLMSSEQKEFGLIRKK